MTAPKRLWIFLVLILLVIAGWFGYRMWNKAPESLVHTIPQHIIDAQQLLSKFQTDPVQSNKLYINKVIQVSGTCINVESLGDSVHFVYVGGNGQGDVLCQLDNLSGPLPKKGDLVQCKGNCAGFDDLTGGVTINRCVLVP